MLSIVKSINHFLLSECTEFHMCKTLETTQISTSYLHFKNKLTRKRKRTYNRVSIERVSFCIPIPPSYTSLPVTKTEIG